MSKKLGGIVVVYVLVSLRDCRRFILEPKIIFPDSKSCNNGYLKGNGEVMNFIA